MIDVMAKKKLGQFQLDAEFANSGVTCLTGKNGAGKTTLLRAMAGLLPIDEGHVIIGGVDVTHSPVEKRDVVVVTPDSSFHHLDVDSHIVWGARLRGLSVGKDEVSEVKSELGIDYKGLVRNLSLGMKERVSLATALLASPKVILVDEAFSSLHQREGFISSYSRLTKDAGIDLVFTSQDENDGRLADHLVVLTRGSTKHAQSQ